MIPAWLVNTIPTADDIAEQAADPALLIARIQRALTRGVWPPDRVFDRLLPADLSLVSHIHWTPLVVALRAAAWIEELQVESVVDIGSGPGKFCIAAALASRARFVGLEQRPRFVVAAEALARAFGVEERVTFVEATFGEAPLPKADMYYLYNPFGENLFDAKDHLDDAVELNEFRHQRDVAAVQRMLRAAATGTYLLTYNGFGGRVPAGYQEVRVDRELPSVLRMWRKRA